MKPQSAHVGNSSDLVYQPSQLTIIVNEWVAATENDLADAFVAGNITKCLLPLLAVGAVKLVIELPSKAVATIDSALAGAD